jgi:hypothetical protein
MREMPMGDAPLTVTGILVTIAVCVFIWWLSGRNRE